MGNLIDSETEIPNIFQTQVVDPLTNKVKNTEVLEIHMGFIEFFQTAIFTIEALVKLVKLSLCWYLTIKIFWMTPPNSKAPFPTSSTVLKNTKTSKIALKQQHLSWSPKLITPLAHLNS